MPDDSTETEAGTEKGEPGSVESSDRVFSKVRGELSEDEFTTPAVARMLLNQISDLRGQLREEKPFRNRFHESDKQNAVLEEKFRTRVSSEIIFGCCLSIGSLLLGITPALWATGPFGVIILWMGIALILGGIVSRIVVLRR